MLTVPWVSLLLILLEEGSRICFIGIISCSFLQFSPNSLHSDDKAQDFFLLSLLLSPFLVLRMHPMDISKFPSCVCGLSDVHQDSCFCLFNIRVCWVNWNNAQHERRELGSTWGPTEDSSPGHSLSALRSAPYRWGQGGQYTWHFREGVGAIKHSY